MANERSDEIMFFLGAGASMAADVPNTFGLVDAFKESIKSDEKKLKTLSDILSILQKWVENNPKFSEKRVDVELLLETLERLNNKDDEVILRFCNDPALSIATDQIEVLIRDLKNYIRSVMVVKQEKIEYLKPLVSFVNDYKELDIFSLNYDTCIEQFCNVYRKSLIDGFETNWKRDVFDKNSDIKLYKLHGSIIWYRTDRGNYVKLLVQDSAEEVKLVTGETAKTLILYPMRKMDYAEPLLELLMMLKERLSRVQIVIVVGYSFRDEHISQVFWDAASSNRNLVIMLISPSSPKTYEERLRFHPSNSYKIPTSLENRVLPLPYAFEKVFPRLLTGYLPMLMHALRNEEESKNLYFKGYPAKWKQTIAGFVECEHMAKVHELLSKFIDWDTLISEEKLDYQYEIVNSFKSLINCVYIKDESRHVWEQRFFVALRRYIAYTRIEPQGVSDTMIFIGHLDGYALIPSNMREILKKMIDWLESKLKIMKENEDIKKWSERIRSLDSYFLQLGKDDLTYQNYTQLRKLKYQFEMTEFVECYKAFQKNDERQEDWKRKLISILSSVEALVIDEIFDGQLIKPTK